VAIRPHRRSVRRSFAALLVATGISALVPATAVFAATSSGTLSYSAHAFGTEVFVGDTITSGRTANVGIGCVFKPGVMKTNTVADLNASPAAVTGVIDTSAASITTQNGTASQAIATIHNVNLLAGVITADEVRAEATTEHVGASNTDSADGSEFVNLQINGSGVSGTPAPNTRIDLPGIGYVILNEQITVTRGQRPSFTVNMIHVVVLQQNPQNVPPATQVIVAQAQTGVSKFAAALDGVAYGSEVTAGQTIVAGRTAVVKQGCLGTNGAIHSNNINGVNVPNALTTGTVVDTAKGTVTQTNASGEMTSTVQSVNLGGGAITADAVRADASASSDGTTSTFSDAGSQFVNLVVSGTPISDPVPANTVMAVPGLGTLYLHRVIQTGHYIEVRMIELIITDPGAPLPVGTDIKVAVAEASVHF
jgi:hypothetical protein